MKLSWGAYSFKPSAGIAGKCTQNLLQISPIYVSTPNSLLLLHTKCTLQIRTQRPQRVEQSGGGDTTKPSHIAR